MHGGYILRIYVQYSIQNDEIQEKKAKGRFRLYTTEHDFIEFTRICGD